MVNVQLPPDLPKRETFRMEIERALADVVRVATVIGSRCIAPAAVEALVSLVAFVEPCLYLPGRLTAVWACNYVLVGSHTATIRSGVPVCQSKPEPAKGAVAPCDGRANVDAARRSIGS